ncbi:MAG TPA: IPT/TIG domain-containing protein [Pyrinomonadaceae bacterium]|nr:IPT/TIG domain-containing protein [Pyrinomonadaceae bacterium]
MPNNNNDPAYPQEPEGPGGGHMKPWWIATVGVYLVVVSALVLYGLIKLWPYPTPAGERPTDQAANQQTAAIQSNGSGTSQTPGNAAGGSTTGQAPTQTQNGNAGGGATNNEKPKKELPDPETIQFFRGSFKANVYLETRLLLLVMLAGALGSLMHSLRSLYWYTGNRKMVWSWVALYLLLPLTGGILATIFYFVVRGGFFSSQASFETTSPFGFVALSALVGLFSPQATLKLKEIAETIFSKPAPGADNKPQESTSESASPKPAPTITSVTRDSGVAGDSVVIAGTNFSDGVVVKFGDVAGSVSSVSDTSITVVVPANPSATGPVDVQVTNADGQSITSPQKFTYVAGGATDAAAVDELDGHEEIKSNTTDEELPITEGGVE